MFPPCFCGSAFAPFGSGTRGRDWLGSYEESKGGAGAPSGYAAIEVAEQRFKRA